MLRWKSAHVTYVLSMKPLKIASEENRMRWICSRSIRATPERVFRAVADPKEFNNAVSEGAGVEYLTALHEGVGTKFRATRMVRGKPQAFDQEVTEFVPPRAITLVNVTHGTKWESRITVEAVEEGAVVTLTMDAISDRLMARVMNRLIAPMLQRALDKDLLAVKSYCEK